MGGDIVDYGVSVDKFIVVWVAIEFIVVWVVI